MTDLLPIFSRVMGVFLVMVAGAVARRFGWVTRDADASLSRLTAYLLLPALFVDRILGNSEFQLAGSAWVPPAIGLVATASQLLLAFAFARRVGRHIGLASDGSQRAFALSVGLCNYGYIPLPLAQHFYPDAEVSLILHNVGVDLALWSVGIWVIGGGQGGSNRQRFFSPPVLAIVAAFAIKQLGAEALIPAPVMQMAGALGQCAVPLGLALSGAILFDFASQVPWRNAIRTILAACGFRLLAMPLLLLVAASLLPLTPPMRQVMLLQAAMPSAVFAVILARLFDKDVATAVQVVLATSVVGTISIPLWLYFGRMWLIGQP
jgi:predicted permease